MKLIVTGHDERGHAVFSHAGTPPRELHPGSWELWATRGAPVVPDASDPREPADVGYFPLPGETNFKIVRVPKREAQAPAGQVPGDLAAFFDSEDPEMHTTDTIDYVIILAGEAQLELDGGVTETVRAGDAVVQRGTRHAWRVTSDEPLVLAAVMLGATRRVPEGVR